MHGGEGLLHGTRQRLRLIETQGWAGPLKPASFSSFLRYVAAYACSKDSQENTWDDAGIAATPNEFDHRLIWKSTSALLRHLRSLVNLMRFEVSNASKVAAFVLQSRLVPEAMPDEHGGEATESSTFRI